MAPAFRYAHQKDKIKVNIWEMGHVVNEDIAAIPFMDKDQKRFVIVIVLDLSKVCFIEIYLDLSIVNMKSWI